MPLPAWVNGASLRIAGMFIAGMAGMENTAVTVASVTGVPFRSVALTSQTEDHRRSSLWVSSWIQLSRNGVGWKAAQARWHDSSYPISMAGHGVVPVVDA